jgi:hypothetical protein
MGNDFFLYFVFGGEGVVHGEDILTFIIFLFSLTRLKVADTVVVI